MCTGIEIAALIGAVASVASAGYAIAQGSPDIPAPPPPPKPPPPPPPAPATPPPPPTETQAEQATATQRRKRQSAYGVEQTLLTTPLGGSASGAGQGARSLLGG